MKLFRFENGIIVCKKVSSINECIKLNCRFIGYTPKAINFAMQTRGNCLFANICCKTNFCKNIASSG